MTCSCETTKAIVIRRPSAADDAEPRPDIIASSAALGCRRKPHTGSLKTSEIAQGRHRPRSLGDPIAKDQEILSRLRREDDRTRLHARRFYGAPYRSRRSENTCSAGIASSGSAAILS